MDLPTTTNITRIARLSSAFNRALRRCHLCESRLSLSNEHTHLCHHCWAALPWIQHRCARCGLATALPVSRCGSCINETRHYSQCVCPLSYEYPVNYLINSFKRGNKQSQKGLLVSIQALGLAAFENQDWEAIVAVPLHSKRQWQRGFNHSHTLAQAIGRLLKIPLVKGFKQTRAHPPQKLLNRAQRQRNLNDAFIMTRPLIHKKILLIDDVVTTGATIEAASKALKQSGAIDVDVLAIARTPKPR